MNDQFVHDIANILEQARQRAKTAVNLSMVYAYYEIGKRIVFSFISCIPMIRLAKQCLANL